MKHITAGEGDITIEIEDGEVTGKAAKSKFMSKAWWKSFFTAFAFHKYTARDWGIWNLSTASTAMSIAGLWKPALSYVAVKAPWLVTALVVVKTAVIGFFKWIGVAAVAAWHIATG